MTYDELEKIITSYGATRDPRSTAGMTLYSLDGEIMVGLEDKATVKLTIRCDHNLAKELKAEYESVVNPSGLSKSHFVTIIMAGQLSDDEVRDLIRHAYEMTKQA